MTKTEYLLTCLAEECAEIQQAATKAIRFGLNSCHPGRSTTNAQDIAREYSDLIGIMGLLYDEQIVKKDKDATSSIKAKKLKVRSSMDVAETRGLLKY